MEPSSGNVFADLGLPNAEELLRNAKLVHRIDALITARSLSMAKAAALLDVSKTDLAALLRGDLDRFSTDTLFRFLNALDQDVDIVVRPKRASSEAAKTDVLSA